MARLTPDPWHVVPMAQMADCNEEGPMAGVFSADDDGAIGNLLATVATDADAQLMAASPDLLLACQRAEEECRAELVRIEMSHGGEIATRLWTELGDVLRAAIKTATGEGS